MKIRIGVLGAAAILDDVVGKPLWAMPDRMEFFAIAARDVTRAQKLAHNMGIKKVHSNYEQLIQDPDVDVVFILLPNALHQRFVELALAAGKHVFCEKPLCLNAAEARRLAKLVAAHPRQVAFEGFHWSFHPQASRARALVDSAGIGEVREWHLTFEHPPMYPEGNIRWDYELGGGCFMDIGCYTVHALRFFSRQEPKVTSATAVRSKYHHLVDESMEAYLKLPDGSTASLRSSFEASEFSMKLVAVA